MTPRLAYRLLALVAGASLAVIVGQLGATVWLAWAWGRW